MAPAPLSTADRACLRALAAWGQPADERPWSHLAEPWRTRLRAARASIGGAVEDDPKAALEALRESHAREARPDPGQVHPSWWARALKDESAAVRLAVVHHAPEPIRGALRRAIGPSSAPSDPGNPPHPGALRRALALWSERLVGGAPLSVEDPPIVHAMAQLGPRALRRLLTLIGLAKRAYAGEVPDPSSARSRNRERLDHFRALWGGPDPRLVAIARRDDSGRSGDPVRDLPRLGLITAARLLATVEPFRARWTLQHLPYALARQLRPWMRPDAAGVSPDELSTWEAALFAAARDRLRDEGPSAEDRR